MKQDRFPLVSDDEIMLTKMPVMDCTMSQTLLAISKVITAIRTIWNGLLSMRKKTVVSPVVNKGVKAKTRT